MTLYLVTKKSQEEDRVGTILRVDVTVYGPFTNEDRADAIAAKYGGDVTPVVVDREGGTIVQRWENPGYASQ